MKLVEVLKHRTDVHVEELDEAILNYQRCREWALPYEARPPSTTGGSLNKEEEEAKGGQKENKHDAVEKKPSGRPSYFRLNLKMLQIQTLRGLEKYEELPWPRSGKRDQLPLKSESEGDSTGLNNEKMKVHAKDFLILDGSMNQIRKIEGLQRFLELRDINLSLNQITSFDGIQKLINLQFINVANNRIQNICWGDDYPPITKLDISANLLQNLGDCSKILTLLELRIQSNNLTSLNGIHTLPRLRLLHAQDNKLKDIDVIISLTTLLELSVAQNEITDLDKLCKVIYSMKSLKRLNCSQNPVEKYDDYRFRILQNESIKQLDHAEIRPTLRDRLKELADAKKLEDIVKQTTGEYMTRIEREKTVLDQGLHFYNSRQQMMLESFSNFKSQMEEELEDCVSYAQVLSTSQRSSYLLSDDGLQDWRHQLDDTITDRLREDAERKRMEDKLKKDRIADASAQLSYHQKLRELSVKRPEIWKEMKRREYERVQLEESAIQRDVEDKHRVDVVMRKHLRRDRHERKNEVLRLAHELALESTAEWAEKIKSIEQRHHQDILSRTFNVKRIMTEEEAAWTIQRKFRDKGFFQKRVDPLNGPLSSPRSVHTKSVDETTMEDVKRFDAREETQVNQTRKPRNTWMNFGKKKKISPELVDPDSGMTIKEK